MLKAEVIGYRACLGIGFIRRTRDEVFGRDGNVGVARGARLEAVVQGLRLTYGEVTCLLTKKSLVDSQISHWLISRWGGRKVAGEL